ncbi:hypothetical protein [Haloarcula amylovorans]|uniref:hypothetical protein n=1 Tax=Haloarcula amylovorans TaxID=2562280 RepID=UPI0010769032|nr:hypothetical protein [Halomicroarcula amylolytica]
MGRKVRCHVTVEDPSSFLAEVRQCFTDNEYELDRAGSDSVLIFTAGSPAWTVVGTHSWKKTSRTVIVSTSTDDKTIAGNVEFLYDVSWLSIHYRPQGKVLTELEEFLSSMGYGDLTIHHEYESVV